MPDQKPTLDYVTPGPKRVVPIDYIGAAAAVGLICGGVLTVVGLFFLSILEMTTFDEIAGESFSFAALIFGSVVGGVIGVIVGAGRWRRWR